MGKTADQKTYGIKLPIMPLDSETEGGGDTFYFKMSSS